MRGFTGKRFSWLLAGSARFDAYASTQATYAAPRASAAPVTLAGKLERIVQAAYGQGDRETGRNLAAVLCNLHRRAGRLDPTAGARRGLSAAPHPGPAGGAALAANDP
ncbi:MAG: hypothetical protein ACREFY_18370 [Acetobacteraceae bacterium]